MEVTKGDVYRALQDEKDKLDREWVRSRRNEDELKAEMVELDAQLADMEAKCQPLWQELDGKLGVLQREIEYKRREWEECGMRLCEEEKRIEWRVEAVQASDERLRPVQQELNEAQAAANEVRSVLEAKQAIQGRHPQRDARDARADASADTREGGVPGSAREGQPRAAGRQSRPARPHRASQRHSAAQQERAASLLLRQRSDDDSARQATAAVEHAAGGAQRGTQGRSARSTNRGRTCRP